MRLESLLFLSSLSTAQPDTPSQNHLTHLHTHNLPYGTLSYWGIPGRESPDWNWTLNLNTTTHNHPSNHQTQHPARRPAQHCGANIVYCNDTSAHPAPATTCSHLLTVLSETQHQAIDPNTRAVYLTTPRLAARTYHSPNNHNTGYGQNRGNRKEEEEEGDTCVLSWHTRVPGLVNGHLVEAAVDTLLLCHEGGRVAGYATAVSLNGVCTVECLSGGAECFFGW
ncbi:uncharacterized protein C8A04DRAFT_29796 [Dichotomopilus funicola]|uniref:Uncharacterized protein n=1 Tax=Dichotomopilus funicola TaxID=1934379 RepID=A0AAN6ZL63_9PEZI|nr:hypothetical protein C8A04DRAFT_29796 [Dichotomopilus funicola]